MSPAQAYPPASFIYWSQILLQQNHFISVVLQLQLSFNLKSSLCFRAILCYHAHMNPLSEGDSSDDENTWVCMMSIIIIIKYNNNRHLLTA